MTSLNHRNFDLTHHAVEQFAWRARGGMDLDPARFQIQQQIDTIGVLLHEPPGWATLKCDDTYTFIALGDDVLLVVVGRRIKTCVVNARSGDRRRPKAPKPRHGQTARPQTAASGAGRASHRRQMRDLADAY